VEDLFEILKHSEGSIIRQYVNAFESYGIDLQLTDPGLYRIAQKAYEEHTGARSLVGVCERTFREYKYNLPHSSIKSLELTERLVDHPDEVLEEMLKSARANQLDEMDVKFGSIADEWSKKNGIRIQLQPEAARLLSKKALETGDKLEDVFAGIFKDYEHGLNLIRGAQGVQKFEITEEVVRNPRAALDEWIRSYYVSRK
jgi:hypothetical protein